MKIHTRIKLIFALSLLVFLYAFASALLTHREISYDLKMMSALEDIIIRASDLRQTAIKTIDAPLPIKDEEWQVKLADIQKNIDKLHHMSPDEIRNSAQLKQTLAEIIKFNTEFVSLSPEQQSNAEIQAKNMAGFIHLSQQMIDTGRNMLHQEREEVAEGLNKIQLAIAALIVAVIILLWLIWHLFHSSILKPLLSIQQGTQQIAAGNYSFRLNMHQHDEIGELASKFDDMSIHLLQSKADLWVEEEVSKRAETALKESTEYTQAILDHAVDGILSINQSGIIVSVNFAICKIFDYRAEELIGQNIKILMPEPFKSKHDQYLSDYQQSSQAKILGISRQVMATRKHGQHFPMDLAVSRVLHNGKPVFIGIVRDVSERHRIEAMKTEFISTVSHELRTPLTSISGALGLVLGGVLGELPAKVSAILKIAHKNSLHLGLLINDLLDMEKLAAGKLSFEFKHLSLKSLITQAIESNQSYAEQFQIKFRFTNASEEIFVSVDALRFQQVMSNLLSNAAKFSNPGGEVLIRLVLLPVTHPLASANSNDQTAISYVRIEIQDFGIGIAEEFHTRIFQKFAQADSSDTRKKGGTGLGLAVCKELIERMNGQIGFSSKPDQGTCFYFDLPQVLPEHTISS